MRAVTGSGGRLHFGMVAGIKSERWPTSNRNPWPDCVGIRTRMQLVRTLASWRPDLTAYLRPGSPPIASVSNPSLAGCYLRLHDEIAVDLDAMIAAIVDELAPEPRRPQFDRPYRRCPASSLRPATTRKDCARKPASHRYAAPAPSTASSGKTTRHRLNRGGDRAANSALHIIAIGRLRTDQRTKDYVARRIAEGHSKLDAIRALKRYLAREVFTLITEQRRKEINATRIAA